MTARSDETMTAMDARLCEQYKDHEGFGSFYARVLATYAECERLRAQLAPAPRPEVTELYHELLYAVAQKFPGESRHQTALRYIREREAAPTHQASTALQGEK